MSLFRLLAETQGCGVRFEPCAPFNSGVDIENNCKVDVSWDIPNSQLSLSHDVLHAIISGDTFKSLLAIKDAISAYKFGDGFVLCVPQFQDRSMTPCHCKYANYGFLEQGVINLPLMVKNLGEPLTWEINVLSLLASHSQSKLCGKIIGERWGVFKDRTDDILSLEYFMALQRTLRESPLADTSIADFVTLVLGQLLSGNREIRTGPGIDFDLNTLVKAIVASKLLSPNHVSDTSLLISVMSMCKVGPDTRKKIYGAATHCKSNIVDAVPRSDKCKLATLPNTLMGLGEINGTLKQVEMLDIVAAPYNELIQVLGSQALQQSYQELEQVMTDYFDRFCVGPFQNLSGATILQKGSTLGFNEFCEWWKKEVKSRLPSTTIGTVQVKMSGSWRADDVIDCFALGVLAGSARKPEYLPIEVNLALMLGIETKILNPMLAPCEWYNEDSQGAEYRVDCHHAGLNKINGETMVRPFVPKETFQDLQDEIKKRTKNVSEDYVLVRVGRPKTIAAVLILALMLMVAQLVFDRAPDYNVFTIATRAVTNFVAISIVVISLIIKVFYNDWSLHDMWNGQRPLTDVNNMAKELKRDFADVVLALRNSGAWDRAMSDTNACLILREQEKKGGVVMKRGLSLSELYERGYLLSCSWSTVVIPRSDGSLEIFQRSKGGYYQFVTHVTHAEGAVIACFGEPRSMRDTVG